MMRPFTTVAVHDRHLQLSCRNNEIQPKVPIFGEWCVVLHRMLIRKSLQYFRHRMCQRLVLINM